MSYLFIQSDATRLPLSDDSVDLVFTSPPYCDARTYGIAAQRSCADWISWMLEVVSDGVRVSRGLVVVNCAGVTRDYVYQPGPEGLLYEWWRRGGRCWRPAYWHRVGIPGSGGPEWLRSDVEHLLCFTKCEPGPSPMREVKSVETITKLAKLGAETRVKFRHLLDCGHYATRSTAMEFMTCGRCVRCLPWSDNTACGHPPKWALGGAMSHRISDGQRVNQWGKNGIGKGMGQRRRNGEYQSAERPSHLVRVGGADLSAAHANDVPKHAAMRVTAGTSATGEQLPNRETAFPVLANPGNLLSIPVGGGLMGHPMAHDNEAPFPEALAEFFVKSFCPPGGTVLDPFSGSGTTVAVAHRLGRRGIGSDLRFSQCELGRKRLRNPCAARPAKRRKSERPAQGLLFGEAS